MSAFALAWRNLVRQKRRTILMGAVVLGKLLDEASGLMGGNYVRVFRQAAAARKA